MFCASCGKEVREGAVFCDACGKSVEPERPSGASGEFGSGPSPFPDEGDVVCFVGEKSGFYLGQFRKFQVGRVESFTPTWNWSAFCFTNGWLLYRKMYLWTLVGFVASFIPIVGFAVWIGTGVAGNYLYYRHVTAKVAEARRVTPESELPGVLAQVGGVHPWVIWVGIAIAVLAILGLAAAILIPFFVNAAGDVGRAI